MKYSEPMTQNSCEEFKRNINAMQIQAGVNNPQWNVFEIDTRCVPVSLISTTNIDNKTTNKIIIRK